MNEKYYTLALSKQQTTKQPVLSNKTNSQNDRSQGSLNTPQSLLSTQVPATTNAAQQQTRTGANSQGANSVKASIPPKPTSLSKNAPSAASSTKQAQSNPSPLPIIGLFGRVPVTVQPSHYHFTPEQKKKLMEEHAVFVRKHQKSVESEGSKPSETGKITHVSQLLRPVVRGIQESKDDLVLELNFEIKDSYFGAEPRRYTGPAQIPADLTLDDQKAVVHFMAYVRSTPLKEIDPEFSWLTFRESNDCEKIRNIVDKLYKGTEGRAIKESLRALKEAKARKARLHREMVAKSISDARHQIGEQESAVKQAMERVINEAKVQTSSVGGSDPLANQASSCVRESGTSTASEDRLDAPSDLLLDESIPQGVENNSEISHSERCGSEVDFHPLSEEDSEDSVVFVLESDHDCAAPSENQLVDFPDTDCQFKNTRRAEAEFHRDVYPQVERLEHRTQIMDYSQQMSRLPTAKLNSSGQYTVTPAPHTLPQIRPTPQPSNRVEPDTSDSLIDFESPENPVLLKPLVPSAPVLSTKPLVPAPKVNLMDAYKRFSKGSVDLGLKINPIRPRVQHPPLDSSPEDSTLVATDPSVSPRTERHGDSERNSLPKPIEVMSRSVKSKPSTPKAIHNNTELLVDYKVTTARFSTPTNLTYKPNPELEKPSTQAYFRDIYSLEAQKEALAAIAPAHIPSRNTTPTQAYSPSLEDSADVKADQRTFAKLALLKQKSGTEGKGDLNVREWLQRSTFEVAPVIEDPRLQDCDDESVAGGVVLERAEEEEPLIVF